MASVLRAAADGRIYASQREKKRIVSYGPDGAEKVAFDKVDATDLAITTKGAIYYTDSARRTLGIAGKAGVRFDASAPAGLTLSGDQEMLVATDALSRFSWSFQIGPPSVKPQVGRSSFGTILTPLTACSFGLAPCS